MLFDRHDIKCRFADAHQIQMRINRIIAEAAVQSMCAIQNYVDLQFLITTLQNPTLQ